MERNYWSDVFTGKTWEEFRKNGSSVTGFKKHKSDTAQKIRKGDYFICYLTGLSRFIGVLEVLSESYVDKSRIWEDESFPIRIEVKTVYVLNAETAVPIHNKKIDYLYLKTYNQNIGRDFSELLPYNIKERTLR